MLMLMLGSINHLLFAWSPQQNYTIGAMHTWGMRPLQLAFRAARQQTRRRGVVVLRVGRRARNTCVTVVRVLARRTTIDEVRVRVCFFALFVRATGREGARVMLLRMAPSSAFPASLRPVLYRSH